jgi:hypothetical protein
LTEASSVRGVDMGGGRNGTDLSKGFLEGVDIDSGFCDKLFTA